MIYSTPHVLYILGAYGVTLLTMGAFLGWACVQWQRSKHFLHSGLHEI
ncbi:MAG: hypothetical protein K2W92_06590 [Alphaproteobacteria bacterium]|nr:hypothetical protein [Alphaproteobacteria bacterium]